MPFITQYHPQEKSTRHVFAEQYLMQDLYLPLVHFIDYGLSKLLPYPSIQPAVATASGLSAFCEHYLEASLLQLHHFLHQHVLESLVSGMTGTISLPAIASWRCHNDYGLNMLHADSKSLLHSWCMGEVGFCRWELNLSLKFVSLHLLIDALKQTKKVLLGLPGTYDHCPV